MVRYTDGKCIAPFQLRKTTYFHIIFVFKHKIFSYFQSFKRYDWLLYKMITCTYTQSTKLVMSGLSLLEMQRFLYTKILNQSVSLAFSLLYRCIPSSQSQLQCSSYTSQQDLPWLYLCVIVCIIYSILNTTFNQYIVNLNSLSPIFYSTPLLSFI